MAEGDKAIEGTQRTFTCILGSSRRAYYPEAWEWGLSKMGRSQCPIVDTWWQTETGGFHDNPIARSNGSKTRLSDSSILWYNLHC